MAKNISIRTVLYNGAEIRYQLERKAVKNLNMRIKRDGSIYVSCHRAISAERVDAFVRSKGEYILAALDRFERLREAEPAEVMFESGDVLSLLGRKLTLIVSVCGKNSVSFDDEHVYLNVTDTDDLKLKQNTYQKFADSMCMEIFGRFIDEIHPKFEAFDIPKPELRIRKMKARWGSCLVSKKIITLNKSLIEHSEKCIEYVVMHEYCHFIHPNHSKYFYALLSSMMPDWKERKSELNKRGY